MKSRELQSIQALRLKILIAAQIGLCFLILSKAARLQLLKNPKLEHLAKKQFQSRVLIKPHRGIIHDRNGEILAYNTDINSLAANPSKIEQKEKIAQSLSSILGEPQKKLLAKLSEKKDFVWLKRHLSETQNKRLTKMELFTKTEAFWFVKESDRTYAHPGLAATVLGDVDIDNEGIEGIEYTFNEKLRGKLISFSAIKDARGRPIFIDAQAASGLQEGESVFLTLDYLLQTECESLLKQAMQTTQSTAGSVIVMDVKTGDILALANAPTFNPTMKVNPEHRRNRVLTDGFEPGSIIKPLILAAALSNGSLLTDEIWGEKGTFFIGNVKITEAETHEKFEWLSLEKMITVSSNIAAAKLALQIGAEKVLDQLKTLGVGRKTGIQFPGEISGKLPSLSECKTLTLANIGFGHALFVTPIQMIQAYSSFFNGGFLVKPRLILSEDIPQMTRVLSPEITHQIVKALLTTTTQGTARAAQVEGFDVAGKTGTAQMIDKTTRKYSKKNYIASFIGAAVNTDPQLVIFVSLQEPQGAYYAGQIAAPLFQKVLKTSLQRYRIAPKQSYLHPIAGQPDIKADIKPDIKLDIKKEEVALDAIKTDPFKMPNLKGLSVSEAMQLLLPFSSCFSIQGFGVIQRQHPLPNSKITSHQCIKLFLADP